MIRQSSRRTAFGALAAAAAGSVVAATVLVSGAAQASPTATAAGRQQPVGVQHPVSPGSVRPCFTGLPHPQFTLAAHRTGDAEP